MPRNRFCSRKSEWGRSTVTDERLASPRRGWRIARSEGKRPCRGLPRKENESFGSKPSEPQPKGWKRTEAVLPAPKGSANGALEPASVDEKVCASQLVGLSRVSRRSM